MPLAATDMEVLKSIFFSFYYGWPMAVFIMVMALA